MKTGNESRCGFARLIENLKDIAFLTEMSIPKSSILASKPGMAFLKEQAPVRLPRAGASSYSQIDKFDEWVSSSDLALLGGLYENFGPGCGGHSISNPHNPGVAPDAPGFPVSGGQRE